MYIWGFPVREIDLSGFQCSVSPFHYMPFQTVERCTDAPTASHTDCSSVRMNEEIIIYMTPNQNFQQKHTAKNKLKNKSNSRELPLTKGVLRHHTRFKKHQVAAKDITGKDRVPFPWRLVSVVLSILCLFLMATVITVAFFTANSTSKRTSFLVQQKENLCPGPPYHPCPKNWVWFKCSCYYFSKEKLTWRESQRACLSFNATLMKIDREEWHFFSLDSFHWIGVYSKATDKHWLWENDSAVPSDTFFLPLFQKRVCLSYKSKGVCFSEDCENTLPYICKNHL
ncbi:killer cell lectin-like receptor subfamily E member 1 isoform X2 [Ochotona curzoniae]|uniref:killer cell lectin-like receptor subfamily E member 1 isoform X2 n=1 Tax=Ochotona curzoniae TaxID=130825 RepID=UPI001B34EE26|nr:killer cell lectin-like receptor subfamily E member 1 isoform X2 [Ochotona curzoniae]